MRKLSLLLVMLIFASAQLLAQRTISGKVTDASDGSSIPGVSVLVKGSTIGTVSDIDGKYSIVVPKNDGILVFSFVGMKTVELPLTSSNTMNVTMESSSTDLEGVVVTALGIKKDVKTLSYSATQVGTEELSKSASTSAMGSLQGKVAGVMINTNSGGPGASSKVVIRGYGSIANGNNPLYIIDGVPLDNTVNESAGYDFGNNANNINPNDIETINILKGSQATALYGSRAAGGAIIITTKKGNKGLAVELDSKVGFSTPLMTPQLQNVFGQGWSGHFAFEENGSWGPMFDGQQRLWGNVYNNSQKLKAFQAEKTNLRDFYDVGFMTFNTLSVGGGNEDTKFRVSIGHDNEDGYLPTNVDSYNRTTISMNGSTKLSNFSITGSANYIKRDGANTPDGRGGTNSAANLYSELLQMPRSINIIGLKDYVNDPFNSPDYFFTPYASNPYFALSENINSFNDDRFYGNIGLEYKFTNALRTTLTVGHDVTSFSNSEHEAIVRFTPGTPQAIWGAQENPGMVEEYEANWHETNLDWILFYDKALGDNFKLETFAGFNAYERGFNSLTSSISSLTIPGYYNLSNTEGTKVTTSRNTLRRTTGVFGSAQFGYKEIAYLTVTARNDWSSTLPKESNSFFYPSVGLSYIATEMFPEMKQVFSFLKLRANWGMNGRDADVYLINSVMISGNVAVPFGSYQFPLGGVNAYEVSNTIGNKALKPELSSIYELGTDMRFFLNRLSIDFTYYNKQTTNQILAVTGAPSTGYTAQTKNFGKIQNVGIETLLTGVPVKTKNFEWTSIISYTRNRNYVLELTEGLDEYVFATVYNTQLVLKAPAEGEKRTEFGLIKVPGILKDDNGNIVVNESGFPQTTAEPEVIGSIQPKYLLGFSNKFRYKNVEVGLTFDIRQGGLMYSGTADLNYFVGNAPQTLYNYRQPFIIPNSVKPNPDYDATDPNSPEYVENDIIIDATNVNNPYYYPSYNLASERDRIISKSYVKFRDFYVNYTMPSNWFDVVGIKKASIGFQGHNLLMWTPEDNNFVDPEITSWGNDITGELGEFRTGPSARTFTFNLKLNF